MINLPILIRNYTLTSFEESNGVTVQRRSSFTDSSSSALDEDATTILILNDDCLLAVFEHLNVLAMAAVADTCNRFKQLSQACFAYSKHKDLDLSRDVKENGDSLNRILLKSSKVLRNFGQFIIAFKEGKINYNPILKVKC